MRLKEIHVSGYRSLFDVQVPFARLTSFIGPNGSGKSSVLAALRLFFDDGAAIGELDFWCGSAGTAVDEISVEVRLHELTEDEQTTFRPYLDASNELVVRRRFEEPGRGSYVAQRRAVPAFTTIRRLERAHRQEYQKLVDSPDYPGLASAKNQDQVFAAMDEWEAAHPEASVLQEVDFTLHSRVTEAITFLHIGAFEDPAAHLEAGGRGAVSRLIESLVDRTAIQSELQAVADDASSKSDAILRDAHERLGAIGESMAEMIESFAPGCKVQLGWDEATVKSARPNLKVEIETSDGLARPLEYQGHGVQRSLMYAALTSEVERATAADGAVVLVIEEPEAFQHPLSCRVLARTVRELSSRNYQIIYSTHSSDFVHPDVIGGLRIVRREDRDGQGQASRIEALSQGKLLAQWQRVFQGGDYTVESVQGRLSAHLTPEVLEGLFARLCVIVEGDEDEALIRGSAAQQGMDLDAAGVAVIQANGKPGIPNVLAFLSLARVACYPVFDLDRQMQEERQHRLAEAQIMRGLDVDDEPLAGIHERYACWENNITATFTSDLGDEYEDLLAASADKFGYPQPSKAKKVAVVIKDVLDAAAQRSCESPSLRALADRIATMAEAAPAARGNGAPRL